MDKQEIIIYNTDDGKNYQVTFYSLDMILAAGKVYERFDQQRKFFESQQTSRRTGYERIESIGR
jgi:hypothetical protein